MIFAYKLVPRRLRTAARFAADDPWTGASRAGFSVEEYILVPPRITSPAALPAFAAGAQRRYGIRSEVDGVERMLPESLGVLFREGRVRPEELPALFHTLEPELRRGDFRPSLTIRLTPYLVGSVVALVLGLGGVVQLRNQQPRASMRILPVESWREAAPAPGQLLSVTGLVALDGEERLAAAPASEKAQPPPGADGWSLGWVEGGGGSRVVLLSRSNYRTGGKVEVGWGPTLAPAELGLRKEVEALSARVPGLDTAALLASRWVPRSSPFAALGPLFALLAAAGAGGLIGLGISYVAVLVPRRRRAEQLVARALALCGRA